MAKDRRRQAEDHRPQAGTLVAVTSYQLRVTQPRAAGLQAASFPSGRPRTAMCRSGVSLRAAQTPLPCGRGSCTRGSYPHGNEPIVDAAKPGQGTALLKSSGTPGRTSTTDHTRLTSESGRAVDNNRRLAPSGLPPRTPGRAAPRNAARPKPQRGISDCRVQISDMHQCRAGQGRRRRDATARRTTICREAVTSYQLPVTMDKCQSRAHGRTERDPSLRSG